MPATGGYVVNGAEEFRATIRTGPADLKWRHPAIPNPVARQKWQPQSTCRTESGAFAHLHFKGLVARCSTFSGVGTDHTGNRIAFGSPPTDFGLMQGEYWAARTTRHGVFAHI
jgi:hypothetical protein